MHDSFPHWCWDKSISPLSISWAVMILIHDDKCRSWPITCHLGMRNFLLYSSEQHFCEPHLHGCAPPTHAADGSHHAHMFTFSLLWYFKLLKKSIGTLSEYSHMTGAHFSPRWHSEGRRYGIVSGAFIWRKPIHCVISNIFAACESFYSREFPLFIGRLNENTIILYSGGVMLLRANICLSALYQ